MVRSLILIEYKFVGSRTNNVCIVITVSLLEKMSDFLISLQKLFYFTFLVQHSTRLVRNFELLRLYAEQMKSYCQR